ncbi:hypothetical protein [Moorena producens]|nr:hypothetical protein [Moorena producens]
MNNLGLWPRNRVQPWPLATQSRSTFQPWPLATRSRSTFNYSTF